MLTTLAATAPGDPLLHDADFTDPAIWLILGLKVLLTFAALLVATMFMVWFERKVISDMQNRIGPDKAGGKFGSLQSLADGIKLFFKEDLLPERADKRVFRLAPYLVVAPAFLAFAIVPIGGIVSIAGHETRLQLADPPAGILWLLVMSSISIYGVMLAGWSSGSKYPLLGSVRASAQMVSYEAALGLSIAAVILVAGALETSAIVENQQVPIAVEIFGIQMPSWLHAWNILKLAVVPFIVFLIAATAELNRPPFDLVEAESELVGGFHTEYSSLRFAMFFLAEFMNTVTMSAVMVTLFFGGGDGPVLTDTGAWAWPVLWFLLKTGAFMWMYVWFRGSLPRLRYDQLMDLGWKVLIPLSLAWLLVVAGMRASITTGVLVAIGVAISGCILYLSMAAGKARAEESDEVDAFGTPSPLERSDSERMKV